MEKTAKKHSGLPMSDESFKLWQKAFSDIDECIEALYKMGNRAYNKETKSKRRK